MTRSADRPGTGDGEDAPTRDPDDVPLHVLAVEDNPGDVRLIEEALAADDVESTLTTVTDGERALDYLRRRDGYGSAPRPDLTLLDLNLPKVDGTTVLDAIEGDPALRPIPVAVLTSSEAREEVRETYEAGADGYFIKPVDPNEFISLVQTVQRSVAGGERVPPGEFTDLDTGT